LCFIGACYLFESKIGRIFLSPADSSKETKANKKGLTVDDGEEQKEKNKDGIKDCCF
jgi:hypothetical protein